LRLEHYSNPTCNDSCFARLATPFTGIAADDSNAPYDQLILSGQKKAYGSTEAVVWEPRFGIAWKPFKHDDKTVIRTGFGIFSDPIAGQVGENSALNSPGNISFTSASPTATIAPGGASSLSTLESQSNQAFQPAFHAGGTLNSISASVPTFSSPNFTSFPNKFQNPEYYKWNFEVQHTLGTKTVISANYSGMHGIRIPIPDGGLNAYCPVSACPAGFEGLPATVPSPAFGTVTQYTSAGVANYNGLQLSVQ
jgi:hypothetical protein